MKVSFILVSYNTWQYTQRAISSIISHIRSVDYEIVVVDNASTDLSAALISQNFPDVVLIKNSENLGFSAANNIGVNASSGDFVCLLNTDTYFDDDFLKSFIGNAELRDGECAIAPTILNVDGTVQRSHFSFPTVTKIFIHSLGATRLAHALLASFSRGHVRLIKGKRPRKKLDQVPYVLFACVVMARSLYDSFDGLDERFKFYHEDCDFGFRMFNSGVRQYVDTESSITHIGGGSSRGVSVFAFENYYAGLLMFFYKHNRVKWYALRVIMWSTFLLRACLTVGGWYRTLLMPSTYKQVNDVPPFGSAYSRSRYYAKLAFRWLMWSE